jgi:hypothetical protein
VAESAMAKAMVAAKVLDWPVTVLAVDLVRRLGAVARLLRRASETVSRKQKAEKK